jgi:RNA polymerase sigma factor (sigma-70 family)
MVQSRLPREKTALRARPAHPPAGDLSLADPAPVRAGAQPARTNPPANTVDTLIAHRRQFLRFLERRVSSPAIAEDILQNAYLRALEHAGELRAGESSTAWFYRILRNAVIDFYRHRTVEDRALETWAKDLETEVPAHDLTRDLVCRCIAKVLPTLPQSYAEILKQVDLDEGTLAAFAARHAITPANATVRIHRARKALKQRLIQACGACALHKCLNCNCIG